MPQPSTDPLTSLVSSGTTTPVAVTPELVNPTSLPDFHSVTKYLDSSVPALSKIKKHGRSKIVSSTGVLKNHKTTPMSVAGNKVHRNELKRVTHVGRSTNKRLSTRLTKAEKRLPEVRRVAALQHHHPELTTLRNEKPRKVESNPAALIHHHPELTAKAAKHHAKAIPTLQQHHDKKGKKVHRKHVVKKSSHAALVHHHPGLK